MAEYNRSDFWGFLTKDPKIITNPYDETIQRVILNVKTIRRSIPCPYSNPFEEVLVYHESTNNEEVFSVLKTLKADDLVYIKGIVRILQMSRHSMCPHCKGENLKNTAAQTFIHPLFVKKLDSFANLAKVQNSRTGDEVLKMNYQEVSHQITLMGYVVSQPEFKVLANGMPCCRYRLAVNRRFYINTEPSTTSDYPWVYSYGKQAEQDIKYLVAPDPANNIQGTLVWLEAFMHNRKSNSLQLCEHCNQSYTYPALLTDFVSYGTEYMNGFKTDEDLALEEELKRMRQ